MKKPSYIIKVNNPCQENWDEMTQNEKGKHCAVCAKTVVDFSKLSDNQVIKLIENSKGKVCGHFNKTQLNRTLIQTNEQTNPFLYQILAGALLLSSCETEKMGKVKIENVEITNPENDDKNPAQTVKSVTKITCDKIEKNDSLRQIEESTRHLKGEYIIETDSSKRLRFIEDSTFKEEVASLSRSEYTNKYKKRNSK